MSGHLPVMMYGALPYQEPDDFQRQLEQLRRTVTLPDSHPPSFTFTPTGFATKADLDEAVRRIETQMLALLAEFRRLVPPKAKRKTRRSRK